MRVLMKLPPVVVSRADRIGDLILSLPTLGYLKTLGFENRILHVAPYCRDVAWWAQYNGLCTEVWTQGAEPPALIVPPVTLSLVYLAEAIKDLRRVSPQFSLGPRTRISALWNFSRSIPQHRSRVEKSEMSYNLDLAREFALFLGLKSLPDFQGLEALKIPGKWTASLENLASPDLLVVVSNRGSALNWSIEKYADYGLRALSEGKTVHFLGSGGDAVERLKHLKLLKVEEAGAKILQEFSNLSQLIAYIAGCGEVLCSSSGPLHLAHAAGVPVTGIYPVKKVQSFARWRPDGYWHGAPIRLIEIDS
jgi:ADP-heptose:LPS heptosyltransferase